MSLDDEWLQQWRDADRITVQASRDPLAKLLLEACRTGDGVDIIYFGGSTPGASRVICPRRLFRVKGYGSIYVEAYCRTREADRIFRLDKIKLSYPTYRAKPTYAPRTKPIAQTAVHSSPKTGCLIYVTGFLIILVLLAIVLGFLSI
jgi:predicted DNA-binding transcriptional regulator YafY